MDSDAPAADPLGLALAAFAREQLRMAQDFLSQSDESRHDGVHQARKSLRRVRATLALGRERLGPSARTLDADVGRLCRGLSRLRDGQALIEALRRLAPTAPAGLAEAMPELLLAARARRDALLAATLAADPELASRRRRLQALARRLELLPWGELGAADVAAAVARSERRTRKAERRAARHPARYQEWHAFRRRLRRLRQQDSLLAPLQPALRPLRENIEALATRLGEAQDDFLLLAHCQRRSPFPAPARALLRAEARRRLRLARETLAPA